MEVMKWVQSYSYITDGTVEKVEQKVEHLLKTLFKNKDDDQKEKFVKTFCEYLDFFEQINCYQRGIHPSQIPTNSAINAHNKEDYERKINEVKNRLVEQMERLDQYWSVILEGER